MKSISIIAISLCSLLTFYHVIRTYEILESDVSVVLEIVSNPTRTFPFPCEDVIATPQMQAPGSYRILNNYVKAVKTFGCNESITYTTHSDYTYLDNLIPLVSRWQGPVSIAIYTPRQDFQETVKRIRYLRHCHPNASLVLNFVTFHLFFDEENKPKVISENPLQNLKCGSYKPKFGANLKTTRTRRNLKYPVNVARNLARMMSTTYYVLPSDIELYPNPGLIPRFLNMVLANDRYMRRVPPKVHVLPVFEVEASARVPDTKEELVEMLRRKTAVSFHQFYCEMCHKIPKADKWRRVFSNVTKVFHVAKRTSPHNHWEPIFIGTKSDPLYDERLSWEGKSDKMTQVIVIYSI